MWCFLWFSQSRRQTASSYLRVKYIYFMSFFSFFSFSQKFENLFVTSRGVRVLINIVSASAVLFMLSFLFKRFFQVTCTVTKVVAPLIFIFSQRTYFALIRPDPCHFVLLHSIAQCLSILHVYNFISTVPVSNLIMICINPSLINTDK